MGREGGVKKGPGRDRGREGRTERRGREEEELRGTSLTMQSSLLQSSYGQYMSY